MDSFKENDTVITPYGYCTLIYLGQNNPEQNSIKVNNEYENPIRQNYDSNNIVELQLKNVNFKVYMSDSLMRNCISLQIKTFFGDRKLYKVCLPINTTIQKLIQIILQSENEKAFFNIRIFYSSMKIQHLSNLNNTLQDYNIQNGTQLIMLVQTTFHWDPNAKGDAIKLSNNNLTVNKNGESDYQNVLGNIEMSSGSHYWEIKIQKFVDEEDIFIGIARKELDLYSQPCLSNQFWGYLCLCGRKFAPDGIMDDYGFNSKINDVIGVLLEFKQGLANLSFFKNGLKCGVAFSDLAGSFYPAISMFYGEVQVTLNPTAQRPIY